MIINHYLNTKAFIKRKILMQGVPLLVAFFIICLILASQTSRYNTLKEQKIQIKNQITNYRDQIQTLIFENHFIDTSIEEINKAQLFSREIPPHVHVKALKKTLVDLAYQYNITSPLTLEIHNEHTANSSLQPTSVSISLNASTDKSILQFIHALTLNLNEPTVIKSLSIHKAPYFSANLSNIYLKSNLSTLFKCTLHLDWFAPLAHNIPHHIEQLTIPTTIKSSEQLYVPSSMDFSLMLTAEERTLMTNLH